MKAITNRHIDLSNYEEKDLEIEVSNGSSMTIQVHGTDATPIKVMVRNVTSEEYTQVSGIRGDFEIATEIVTNGIFNYDVAGIDLVLLETNNASAIIDVKVCE